MYAEWGYIWSFFNAYDPINEDKGRPIVYGTKSFSPSKFGLKIKPSFNFQQ